MNGRCMEGPEPSVYRTLFCSNLADQSEALSKVLQLLFRRNDIKSQYRTTNGMLCHLLLGLLFCPVKLRLMPLPKMIMVIQLPCLSGLVPFIGPDCSTYPRHLLDIHSHNDP